MDHLFVFSDKAMKGFHLLRVHFRFSSDLGSIGERRRSAAIALALQAIRPTLIAERI